MANIKSFEKFIEQNYPGLNYISLANEEYVPGQILNSDDRILDNLSRVFPNEAPNKWSTKRVDAHITGGSVSGQRNLDFGLNVLGIFSLKAGAKANYSIQFSFDKVSQIVFDIANGAVYENEVRSLINELKQHNRPHWRMLLHEFVVMESLIVENMRVTFRKEGNVVVAADIPALENAIKVDASYEWNAQGEMEITNNKLPFGVLGFTVKRIM